MIAPIAWAEWTLALRRRRLLALNAGIPVLLVAPVAFGGAPPFHAAAVYAVLFVLFGTMGSAIPLLRTGEAGLLRRMVLTGYPPSRILLERAIAGTIIDLLQLVPAVALILLASPSGRASASGLLVASLLVASLLVALLAANLLGIWIAAAARSLAEGALFAAVTSLFLLHGAGVFRTAIPGSWGARVESVVPFAPLHRILLEVATGGIGDGTLTALAPSQVRAVSVTIVVLLLTTAIASPLCERISRGSLG